MWWYTPVILVTTEAEIRAQAKSYGDPDSTKKLGMVACATAK
jgi:hypothetical protein